MKDFSKAGGRNNHKKNVCQAFAKHTFLCKGGISELLSFLA